MNNIDLNTAVGKHDNYSLLRELTAYEYANRYHTMLRFSNAEDVTQDDIYASILGDLLEDLDLEFEAKWILNPDDYFDESVDIQNTVKQEQTNKTSGSFQIGFYRRLPEIIMFLNEVSLH